MGNELNDTGKLKENSKLSLYIKDFILNKHNFANNNKFKNYLKKRACCSNNEEVPVSLPVYDTTTKQVYPMTIKVKVFPEVKKELCTIDNELFYINEQDSNYKISDSCKNFYYDTSNSVTFNIPNKNIPSKIESITIKSGSTFIDLSWNAPSNGGINISSYLIRQSTDLSNWIIVGSTRTSATINYLLNNTKYYFKIQARNSDGFGPESDIVNITTTTKSRLFTYIIIAFIILVIIIGIVFMMKRNAPNNALNKAPNNAPNNDDDNDE